MIKMPIFFLLVALLCACTARPIISHPDESVVVQPRVPESTDAQAIYSYLAFREYLQEQKPTEAAEALEKAISIAPTAELYMELGNLYWRTSRFQDAVRVLKEALKTYPDSRILLSALAKTYAVQGRFDDAVLFLDDYLKAYPDTEHRLDIQHEAALYRMEERRFDDAVDRLSAIPKNQASPVTGFLLGKALAGLGLLDRAIAQFQQVVAVEPEYFDAWVELGLTYEAQKNYIQADRIFTHLLNTGEANPQVAFKLADINLKLNDPDRALAIILQYPDDPDLALEAAALFLSQEFPDHAAQLLDPLAEQKPIPVDALFYLALLEYENRDNPEQALVYLKAIPANHPLYERSLLFRIHALYQSGQEDAARSLCAKAIEQFPNQPEFPLALAEIDERQGDLPKALETLLAAGSTWPDNTVLLYRLGALYERMEKRDQALATMEKIIHLEPEHADALNFLGYTLADEGRDLERAEVLIQNALRIKPDNGYYVDSLAWVYYRQGKISQAWQEIRRAVHFVETDAVIWEHYGDIAKALGLPGEARKGYSKALELEGDNAQSVREKLNGLKRK